MIILFFWKLRNLITHVKGIYMYIYISVYVLFIFECIILIILVNLFHFYLLFIGGFY